MSDDEDAPEVHPPWDAPEIAIPPVPPRPPGWKPAGVESVRDPLSAASNGASPVLNIKEEDGKVPVGTGGESTAGRAELDAGLKEAEEAGPAPAPASNATFWRTRRGLMVIGGIVFLLVVLIIGLGAGLGTKKKHGSSPSPTSTRTISATAGPELYTLTGVFNSTTSTQTISLPTALPTSNVTYGTLPQAACPSLNGTHYIPRLNGSTISPQAFDLRCNVQFPQLLPNASAVGRGGAHAGSAEACFEWCASLNLEALASSNKRKLRCVTARFGMGLSTVVQAFTGVCDIYETRIDLVEGGGQSAVVLVAYDPNMRDSASGSATAPSSTVLPTSITTTGLANPLPSLRIPNPPAETNCNVAC